MCGGKEGRALDVADHPGDAVADDDVGEVGAPAHRQFARLVQLLRRDEATLGEEPRACMVAKL